MELTTDNVFNVTMHAMPTNDETAAFGLNKDTDTNVPIKGVTFVQGAMRKFAFVTARLEEKRADIMSMLEQLPDDFMAEKGGGTSLMNMPFTKDGIQWGEQYNADNLFVLGAGLGLCKFLMPRDVWSVLPGGMPYIVVDLTEKTYAVSAA